MRHEKGINLRFLIKKKSEDNTLWLNELINKIEDMKNNIFDTA